MMKHTMPLSNRWRDAVIALIALIIGLLLWAIVFAAPAIAL